MSELSVFIEEELTKRENDYKSSPAYIIEHYNIERQNVQAYNGRQLLEMLQNADDACESAEEKIVSIVLKDDLLVIANNGEPFSIDGFRSIMYSNLSIKNMQQNKIGQKGLGFRSILSWAEEVSIQNRETKISFSDVIATSFLETILRDNPHVSTFLHAHSKVSMPIATLRVASRAS